MDVHHSPLNARPTHHSRILTGTKNTGCSTRFTEIQSRGLGIELWRARNSLYAADALQIGGIYLFN